MHRKLRQLILPPIMRCSDFACLLSMLGVLMFTSTHLIDGKCQICFSLLFFQLLRSLSPIVTHLLSWESSVYRNVLFFIVSFSADCNPLSSRKINQWVEGLPMDFPSLSIHLYFGHTSLFHRELLMVLSLNLLHFSFHIWVPLFTF